MPRHLSRLIPAALATAMLASCGGQAKSPAGLSAIRCGADLPRSVDGILADPRRFIAHAGGAIDGTTYTDSREALLQAIENGFRLIELDFIMTADRRLVAAHDWKNWRKESGSTLEHPTLEEFLAVPVFGKWTPMSFADVVAVFREHPELILVTDKTKHFHYLANEFPFPDRLLVEVFSEADLRRAKAAGIRYPMPSTLWERKDFESLIKVHGLKFLALHTRSVEREAAKIRRARELGACTFAFSTNEEAFVAKNLTRDLFGVYTDYFVPRLRRFICAGPCTTY